MEPPIHQPLSHPYLRALRNLDRRVSKTLRDLELIGPGDRVLVGVSGGKDSLTLLDLLALRKRWRPDDYGLVAGHLVDGGCAPGCEYAARLGAHCEELGVPLRVVEDHTVPTETEVSESGKSPCFLCSWRRRKRLLELAQEEDCRLLALGHHKDDAAQTLLLNLFWQGRHESMLPRQPLFGGRLTVIRPLYLSDEKAIARVARIGGLPLHDCHCRWADDSRRETAAEIIALVRRGGVRDVTTNLVRTVLHPKKRREEESAMAGRVESPQSEVRS